MKPWMLPVGLILAGMLAASALASFAFPHLNFPIVSQVVCSVRGGTWYDGGLLGPPGCYTYP